MPQPSQEPDLATLIRGCESELLHLSGQIQPYGAMLITDTDGRITHASANIGDFLAVTPGQLLERPLKEALPDLDLAGNEEGWHQGFLHDPQGQLLDVMIHAGDGCWLLEFMPTGGIEALNRHLAGRFFPDLMQPPDDEAGLRRQLKKMAAAIQSLTQFGRVMIYRFLPDWSGEVVAEVSDQDDDKYLGLRFPASDIPAIARLLYRINQYRLIPDSRAEPVFILSNRSDPPDLTTGELRSVSPIHLEYLRNMGVGASFSIAVPFRGNLWGLIACHHPTPLYLNTAVRRACNDLGRALGLTITAYHAGQRIRFMDSIDHQIENICIHLGDGCQADSPDIQKHLLNLVDAKGVVILSAKRNIALGAVPDQEQIAALDRWFTGQGQELIATDSLHEILPDIDQSTASGVLAVRLPQLRGETPTRCYWLRPELPREVSWAGAPTKDMDIRDGVPYLSPRKSFERWVEVSLRHCKPWSELDILTAKKFRSLALRWLTA